MVRSLLPLGLLLGLVSCQTWPQNTPGNPTTKGDVVLPVLNPGVNSTPIQTLEQRQNQTVYLEGKVGKQVPFLGSRAYELQDSTGTVWVVTAKPAPASGTAIAIRGIVRSQRITQAGQDTNELYIEEQEQLPSSSVQSALPRR